MSLTRLDKVGATLQGYIKYMNYKLTITMTFHATFAHDVEISMIDLFIEEKAD